MSNKINCKVCQYRKPRCDNGTLVYEAMTKRLLLNELDYDDKHNRWWEAWRLHSHDKPLDQDIERECKDFLAELGVKSLYG